MPASPAPSSPPAPRLARLDVHGFKSFANRTVFVFEPGITAIVGPNGSGKSNISDAVRWVLGETSYSALRSKKTDDVIFAGGQGKAPAGLAEVTLTFNNEEHWLPSEFTEVTVTRRAYRGGENQYFLNGRRVRLKDVTQLTASLGQSYTVVGQGLVDVALSQKAEERRGLFEHAADLAGLRLKVAEAERNLTEADNNTDRLRDLLTELEPRLKSLERSAKQAKEWQGLRDRQSFLQRGHYRRLLVAATAQLTETEAAVASDGSEVAAQQATLESLIAERARRLTEQATARDALATHDARLGAIREQVRRASHERDLVTERLAALERRQGDARETRTTLDEQLARVEAEVTAVTKAVAAVDQEREAARAAVGTHEATVRTEQDARGDLERQVADLARAISQQERHLAEVTQRRALIEHAQATSATDEDRIARDGKARNERLTALTTELAELDAADAALKDELSGHEARLAEIATALTRAQEELGTASSRLADAERRVGQASQRLQVLTRLQEEGAGLHAGVRFVVQAQRAGNLSGIRGTVAELIAVDATYDTAIEVALGGHLQDIVVERWSDAEAAIAALKQARIGRATFQPLDTLANRGERAAPRELDTLRGCHGVAAELVQCDADIAVVVRALLGRIVVVESLADARNAIRSLPGGWSAVTLGGEIARSGGSVTGGAAVRESGALGRERDLRELPAEIKGLEAKQREALAAREALLAGGQELRSEQQQRQNERAGLLAQRKERVGQRQRLETWLKELRTQQEAADRQGVTAADLRTRQAQELEGVEAKLTEVTAGLTSLREQHGVALRALEERRSASGSGNEALTEARQQLAALEERLRSEQRRQTAATSQKQALLDELRLREQRDAAIEGEHTALGSQHERQTRELARLTEAESAATAGREPLATASAEHERVLATLEQQVDQLRQTVVERERAMNQGVLAVERSRAELTAIQQRIIDDLGYEEPATLADEIDESPVDPGWTLDDDHTVVEREITRLRDRLRRVGYVGDDVVEEFERESAHFTHLREQLQDVMEAALAIRGLLADLNETMQERFERTFEAVAAAFTESFQVLFGGGTARLVLTTDDESGAPGGIDIVAQPPGKRLQGLALLSGGERSLTAVALLFAILKVNPTPFVLLDEVDAALDEANVVRFRDELRTLAAETQAVVITHNRGTVEIADTLYGVTMGDNGVSQVLSLRLTDLPLDDEIDVRDLAAVSSGVPVR